MSQNSFPKDYEFTCYLECLLFRNTICGMFVALMDGDDDIAEACPLGLQALPARESTLCRFWRGPGRKGLKHFWFRPTIPA